MAEVYNFDDHRAGKAPGTPTQADLKGGGGGGTSDGMTEDWKASVDRQLAQLHSDFRGLLTKGALAVVSLAGLIGGLYVYEDAKFGKVSDRLTAIEVHQKEVEGKIDTNAVLINSKLDRLLEERAERRRK